jgi:hypothetical protein
MARLLTYTVFTHVYVAHFLPKIPGEKWGVANIRNNFTRSLTLWFLFTLITTPSKPQSEIWIVIFPTVFFLWTACLLNFNGRPIIFTRPYNTRITVRVSITCIIEFPFQSPRSKPLFHYQRSFRKYIKTGVNLWHTFSNYKLALLKIYWALIGGGKPSVINNSRQQPTRWNVDNTCLFEN